MSEKSKLEEWFLNNDASFQVKWCELCRSLTVKCPKCGMCSCSGGYGEIDGKKCDICPICYKLNDIIYEEILAKKTKTCQHLRITYESTPEFGVIKCEDCNYHDIFTGDHYLLDPDPKRIVIEL